MGPVDHRHDDTTLREPRILLYNLCTGNKRNQRLHRLIVFQFHPASFISVQNAGKSFMITPFNLKVQTSLALHTIVWS